MAVLVTSNIVTSCASPAHHAQSQRSGRLPPVVPLNLGRGRGPHPLQSSMFASVQLESGSKAKTRCQRHLRGAVAATGGAQAAANPVGVHCLTWVGGWSEQECRLAVGESAKLGFDLVEIPVLDPDTVDTGMTKAVLQEYGMRASTSLGLSLDADISSDDPEVARRGEELLLKAVDVAVGVGAEYLVGVTYSAIAKYSQPFVWGGRGHGHMVKALRRVARKAADGGVVFGLEVVNRYESNVLNTAQQAMTLLSELNEPNVIIHLDSYHMNIEEGNLARAVELCGPALGYVHVGESHRGYLGTGTVDFQALFRALAASGFQGPLTFESFSSTVVNKDLSNTLCVWRNLWDDSKDLAGHAKMYIDAQWAAAKLAAPSRS